MIRINKNLNPPKPTFNRPNRHCIVRACYKGSDEALLTWFIPSPGNQGGSNVYCLENNTWGHYDSLTDIEELEVTVEW